jgi:hypothetical protein
MKHNALGLCIAITAVCCCMCNAAFCLFDCPFANKLRQLSPAVAYVDSHTVCGYSVSFGHATLNSAVVNVVMSDKVVPSGMYKAFGSPMAIVYSMPCTFAENPRIVTLVHFMNILSIIINMLLMSPIGVIGCACWLYIRRRVAL